MKKQLIIIFTLLLTLILLPISIVSNKVDANENKETKQETNEEFTGLCFTAKTAGATVTLKKVGLPSWTGFYSTDGETWTQYVPGATGAITLTNKGDKVYFKGTYTAANDANNYLKFVMVGSSEASGNVMSLCSGDNYKTATEIPYAYMFYNLFNGCTSLTTAPTLPAMTLTDSCYKEMFRGCTSLTATPTLSATELAASCYAGMFYACGSLTTITTLPATILKDSCYTYMFYACGNLTTLPALPATTLTNNCYEAMFGACTNIKLSATTTTEYQIPYRIPTSGEGTAGTDSLKYMFSDTGGTFSSTPEINKEYYLPGAKLTYNANGATSGSVPEIEYHKTGDEVTVKGNTGSLVKTGYDFADWNTKEDGKGATYVAGETFTISASMTLYAKWEIIDYNITYNLDGGELPSGKSNPTTYTIETPDITLYSPTKTGYSFDGFYKNAEFTGDKVEKISKGSTGDLDLYAKWNINEHTPYKVVHKIQDLVASTYIIKEIEKLDGPTGSSITPEVKSYTGFTAPSKQTTTIAADGSTIVTYLYTRNSYDLTVTAGTGIKSCSGSGTYKYEQPVTLGAALKDGYKDIKYSGIEDPHNFKMPASNTETTVSATAIEYTITYVLNGGTEPTTPNPTEYTVETESFTFNAPTKKHYTFDGFYEDKACIGTKVEGITKGSTTGDKIYYAKWINYNGYLTFTANVAGATVNLKKVGLPSWTGFYSTDGETWTQYVPGATGAITLTNKGDKVYFKGTYTAANDANNYLQFVTTKSIAASGNIMSLCSGDDYATVTEIPYAYMFYRLFKDCQRLTSAPSLPATTLKDSCYEEMFEDCEYLTVAPSLPAMTLTDSCYKEMFRSCDRLIATPKLAATELAPSCYTAMFYACENLITITALPATTLTDSCYKY